MSGTCHILARSTLGHVILFGEVASSTPATAATCNNLAFQYGSTSLWLTNNELRWLAKSVSQFSLKDLCYLHPHQEHIQLEMPLTNLKFSFLLSELLSLEHLLTKAVRGLHWREILAKSMN